MRHTPLFMMTVCAVGLGGCLAQFPEDPGPEAGILDLDGGLHDVGGSRDRGIFEPDARDLGRPDAAERDVGQRDMGAEDAGPRDEGPADASELDAAPPDLGPTGPLIPAPDQYDTLGGCPLTVPAEGGVLANDDVPPGAQVIVTAQPQQGALAMLPDGGFTYTPSAVAEDTFSYQVVQGGARSAVVSVQITPPLGAVVVDRDDDGAVGCTLRRAIEAADRRDGEGCETVGGAQATGAVVMGPGIETITVSALTGPLPFEGEVQVLGCGQATTQITTDGLIALLEVERSSDITLRHLTLTGGAGLHGGGAARVEGTLRLEGVAVLNNLGYGGPGQPGELLGGNGGGGGGGARGGAIYVGDDGELIATPGDPAERCRFELNRAVGGDGGPGRVNGGAFEGRGGDGGGPDGGDGGDKNDGRDGGRLSGGGGGGGHRDGRGDGGDGGFAGGGGGGGARTTGGDGGDGGDAGFAGGQGSLGVCAAGGGGGGGAGLGGAIYNDGGEVTLTGCQIQSNVAQGGRGGGIPFAACGDPGEDGRGLGGALFVEDGDVTLESVVLEGNRADQGADQFICGEDGDC